MFKIQNMRVTKWFYKKDIKIKMKISDDENDAHTQKYIHSFR